MPIVRPSDSIVPELLSALNNHSFLNKCHTGDFVTETAIQSLIVKFPNAKDYIIRQYILAHDPVEAPDVHIGNYGAKYDIFSILMSDAGHSQMIIRGHTIDLCKHILIHGYPGVGKTSFIHRLKRWFDVIEVNASDTRTLSQIAGILTGAGKMTSLSSREQIVVFDEMDNMAKSGVDFLLSLIGPSIAEYERIITESGGQPTVALKKLLIASSHRSRLHIIMLCNYIDKVSMDIRTNDRVKVLEFSRPDSVEIETLLQLFVSRYWDDPDQQEYDESLMPSPERVKQVATECHGDVRVALSMLLGGDSYGVDEDTRPLDYTALLFVSSKRDELFESLIDDDISPTTICSYVAYNIPRFYDTASEIDAAFTTVQRAETLKYKADARYIWGVLVFGLPLSKYVTIRPQYPPRKKDQQIDSKLTAVKQPATKQRSPTVKRYGKKRVVRNANTAQAVLAIKQHKVQKW
jgi:GTPase SAR1 family protein